PREPLPRPHVPHSLPSISFLAIRVVPSPTTEGAGATRFLSFAITSPQGRATTNLCVPAETERATRRLRADQAVRLVRLRRARPTGPCAGRAPVLVPKLRLRHWIVASPATSSVGRGIRVEVSARRVPGGIESEL